jgi:predicted neuraminidase
MFCTVRKTIFLFILMLMSASVFAQSIIQSAFLFEEGKYFSQCHASTIVESHDGLLLTSWFGGSHEGNKDVVIWGITGDEVPKIWADGKVNDTLQYPCWNPVLFRAERETKIYLYYKVGPNPREWWGMVKTSDDNGRTWSKPVTLPKGILGPIKNKPVELNDGTIIAPSSVEVTENRWVAHVEVSTDRQKTWKAYPIDHYSRFNVIQPGILVYQTGKIQVLCRSKEGVVVTSWSEDKGKTWSALEKTNLINPNAATDVITIGNKFYIVYNPDLPGRDWWEGRAKLRLAESTDGLQWKDLLILEDQEKGEFSYPAILQDKKGRVHITYTYNRKNIKHVIVDLSNAY